MMVPLLAKINVLQSFMMLTNRERNRIIMAQFLHRYAAAPDLPLDWYAVCDHESLSWIVKNSRIVGLILISFYLFSTNYLLHFHIK
jgi:hypothetical protein